MYQGIDSSLDRSLCLFSEPGTSDTLNLVNIGMLYWHSKAVLDNGNGKPTSSNFVDMF
jgi:hypothetical protein